MKKDYQFSMNRVSKNVDWMKIHVIQNKNGVMMNIYVSLKS